MQISLIVYLILQQIFIKSTFAGHFTVNGKVYYYNTCDCGRNTMTSSNQHSSYRRGKRAINQALKVGDINLDDYTDDSLNMNFKIALNLSELVKYSKRQKLADQKSKNAYRHHSKLEHTKDKNGSS